MHPFIKLGEGVVIPTYILIISLVYCIALIWANKRAIDQERSRHMALDIGLAIMVGGFLGGRMFHVFYEYPTEYLKDPLRIFRFWEGGFVFYGGFIGALVFAALFIKRRRESFLEWADFYAPILSLGYALGRLGCFFNGCCYGKLCDLPWAVEFHFPGVIGGARHPTQLYATLMELIVFMVIINLEKRWLVRASGMLFFTWLALHGSNRLLMEFYRDDFRGPALGGLSISSWLSVTLLAFSLFMLASKSFAGRQGKS